MPRAGNQRRFCTVSRLVSFLAGCLSQPLLPPARPLSNTPPEFFQKNKLALKEKKYWYFYPVTTGITLLQTASSLMNRRHQWYTIVPFHFIPPMPVAELKKARDYRCRQAEPGGTTLMDRIMEEFLDSGETNDMRLGFLLHVYADTYAHQNFSGRWGRENYSTIKQVIGKDGSRPVDSGEIEYYHLLPAVGHAEVGHVPDLFGIDFEARFDWGLGQDIGNRYKRSNMEVFLLCARRIWRMLRRYNGQQDLTDQYFDQMIAPKIQAAGMACLEVKNGKYQLNEWEDQEKLRKIWEGVFQEERIRYSYAYSDQWGLKEKKVGTWGRIYEAGDEFFQFNQCAYEHLHQIMGSYREEELYGKL